MGLALVTSAPAMHLGVALIDVAKSCRPNNFVFGTGLDFTRWVEGFRTDYDEDVTLAPGTTVYIFAVVGGTSIKGYEDYPRPGHAVVKAKFVDFLPRNRAPEEKKPVTDHGETPAPWYWEVKDLVRLCDPIKLSDFISVKGKKPLPSSPRSPMLAWEK